MLQCKPGKQLNAPFSIFFFPPDKSQLKTALPYHSGMFCLKQPQLIHESLWNNLQYMLIYSTLIPYHTLWDRCVYMFLSNYSYIVLMTQIQIKSSAKSLVL